MFERHHTRGHQSDRQHLTPDRQRRPMVRFPAIRQSPNQPDPRKHAEDDRAPKRRGAGRQFSQNERCSEAIRRRRQGNGQHDGYTHAAMQCPHAECEQEQQTKPSTFDASTPRPRASIANVNGIGSISTKALCSGCRRYAMVAPMTDTTAIKSASHIPNDMTEKEFIVQVIWTVEHVATIASRSPRKCRESPRASARPNPLPNASPARSQST